MCKHTYNQVNLHAILNATKLHILEMMLFLNIHHNLIELNRIPHWVLVLIMFNSHLSKLSQKYFDKKNGKMIANDGSRKANARTAEPTRIKKHSYNTFIACNTDLRNCSQTYANSIRI